MAKNRGRRAIVAIPVLAFVSLIAVVLLFAASLAGVTDEANTAANATNGACATDPVAVQVNMQSAIGLDARQLTNAGEVIAVGKEMGFPDRGLIVSIMTALQESNILDLANSNVPESMTLPNEGVGRDHTSVGVFQQLNAWGSAAERLDTRWAARQFFEHLARVPNWESLPLTVAAQKVQISAFPNAYAKWETLATQIVGGAIVAPGVPAPAPTCQPGTVAAPVAAPGAAPAEGAAALTTGRVSSCFGQRWGTAHNGVDIAAPIGTPIYAPEGGTIARAGAASGFGQAIYMRHPDGTVSVYGHISRSYVSAGQTVGTGAKIAEVGNEGQSTGPHLHFEIHPTGDMYGGAVSPIPWLTAHGINLGGSCR